MGGIMKYVTKLCEGYWEDEPERIFPVTIALNDWDEEEDWEDEQIFYYMDGEPLTVGSVISDGFVITAIDEHETDCPAIDGFGCHCNEIKKRKK
jgi:hypothetical protein